MARREYVGGAGTTTLNGALSAGGTTINITDGTGWPTGGTGPFCVDIDFENSSYEKILVTSRSGNVLTVASASDRGYDDTTDTSHLDNATIRHVVSAVDLDEANAHINNAGAVLHTSAALATDSVTATQIAAGAVDTSELAADAVDGTKLADNAVDSEHITAGAIDLAHMSANSIDSDQYVDGSIDTAHIADSQVTNAKAGFTWTTWTPQLYQGGNVTSTNTRSFYMQLGNLVIAYFSIAATGAGTASNNIEIRSLPVTAAHAQSITGPCYYFDTGVSDHDKSYTAVGATTTSFNFRVQGGDNVVGSGTGDAGITIASGDLLRGHVIYEAA